MHVPLLQTTHIPNKTHFKLPNAFITKRIKDKDFLSYNEKNLRIYKSQKANKLWKVVSYNWGCSCCNAKSTMTSRIIWSISFYLLISNSQILRIEKRNHGTMFWPELSYLGNLKNNIVLPKKFAKQAWSKVQGVNLTELRGQDCQFVDGYV